MGHNQHRQSTATVRSDDTSQQGKKVATQRRNAWTRASTRPVRKDSGAKDQGRESAKKAHTSHTHERREEGRPSVDERPSVAVPKQAPQQAPTKPEQDTRRTSTPAVTKSKRASPSQAPKYRESYASTTSSHRESTIPYSSPLAGTEGSASSSTISSSGSESPKPKIWFSNNSNTTSPIRYIMSPTPITHKMPPTPITYKMSPTPATYPSFTYTAEPVNMYPRTQERVRTTTKNPTVKCRSN
ncbi:uncharacterized protein FOMMEDRAFT_155754 [Fomitiporia mediterranea MF3/22]|uniref:uncharacterized protein n=1 Tax=Fomitiporia mediterranea (strain MF3/22) TaxID=694068 RepID=UPI0004407D2D|nr:uncharacterized protein FOMMEDRAFT_155754 [Fomitiporia mediterranea MF3/22]EJD04605.1 hypothetical protein FOMMEDRAFT_155754 [Fomitiporia mediterranea MF3/22]